MSRLVAFAVVVSVVAAFGPAAVRASDGADTTHFTASYFNGLGGYFTCAGERIVKTAPKAFIKDSETCTISDIGTFPPGTYVGPPIVINNHLYGWASDYDGRIATSVVETVTDNGDGTGTLQLVAYYN